MIKAEDNTNALFPVFLKLETLRLLIVGGGKVGLEKLQTVLRNSPHTDIRLIATSVCEEIKQLAKKTPSLEVYEGSYEPSYLDKADVVIVAVNDKSLSEQIRNDAKQKGKLVNVADTPELCDFYLSSIVQKGNLKIAISTNGKSPTIAKRLKETFNNALPDEIDDVLNNMEIIRKKMNGNFADKVDKLNNITRVLVDEESEESKKKNRKFGKVAGFIVIALLFMALGQVLFPYLTIYKIFDNTRTIIFDLGSQFYSMLFTGFVAQIFASSLGMGYGVICTTILLSFGINLPAISGSIHTAETFSMGVAGYSHYRFGNVNKKLLKALLFPGIIGAVLGAWMLAHFGDKYAIYIKPVIALYTLALGLKILSNAFRKKKIRRGKVKNANVLAGVGGFIDSFGGGGWGPLVTSSIIAKGKSPRFVIGTSDIGKFFVTLASALTFFHFLGVSHWQIVAGLLIGGVAAAPIGAKLAGVLPGKTMYISVGVLVILCSLRIFFKSIGLF